MGLTTRRALFALTLASFVAACGGETTPPDVPDAGTETPDAGNETPDAGTPDGGNETPDAGTPDGGNETPDGGGTNTAPVPTDATLSTNEDTPLTGQLAATDADGDALTFARTGQPSHGTVTVESNGSFIYTPAADYAGPDSFTFIASDAVAESILGTVSITVVPVNDAPRATGSLSMDEEGALTITLDALTVTDPDSDLAQVTLVEVLDGEGYSVAAEPLHTIVADSDVTGTITVAIVVSDGTDTATANITVDVRAINDAPLVTGNVTITTDEDVAFGPITVGDLTIVDPDSDPAGHVVEVQTFPGARYSVESGGIIRPDVEFSGPMEVRLTVTDAEGGVSEPYSFTVEVVAVDDAPILIPADPPLQTQEEVGFRISHTNLNIHDPDSVEVLVTVLDGEGYTHDGSMVTPDPDRTGELTVNVLLDDGVNAVSATVIVLVSPVNDVPRITGLVAELSTDEDTAIVLSLAQLVIVDPDDTAETLSLNVLEGEGYTVDAETRTVTPERDRTVAISVRVTVSDASSTSEPFDVVIAIQPINDAPEIIGQRTITLLEDGRYQVLPTDFEAIDPDDAFPTAHTVTLVPGTHYTLDAGDPTGTTIVPDRDFAGTLTVFATLTDEAGGSDTWDLTITVTEVNDVPVIDALTPTLSALVVDEDGRLVVTAADLNASDVDDSGYPAGFVVTLSDDSSANHYTLEGNPVAIVPEANYNGPLVVPVTVRDPRGGTSASVNLAVTVRPVDDAPTISAIADVSTLEDTAVGPISFTVGDIDTPVGNLVVTATSGNTVLVPNANIVIAGTGASRTVSITPGRDQSGLATITVSVSDGITTVTRTFRLDVGAGNDAPTISSIADQVIDEDGATGALAFTIGDVDSPVDLLLVTATSSNGALVASSGLVVTGSGANRSIRVTPLPNQAGTTTITIAVSDGTLSATTSFRLTVNGVNDAPSISVIGDVSTNEDTPVGPISFTIGDLETDASSLVITVASSDSTLVPVANITIGGSGSNRTVAIVPAANRSGSSLITITVSDGVATASEPFTVRVDPVDDAPTVSAIADLATDEDVATAAIPFTVADVDTAVTALVVTATSSNQTVLPSIGVVLGGSGANRTITLTPAAQQSGSSLVTVTVSDGSSAVVKTFTLTVNAVNDLPTISAVSDASIDEDATLAAVAFTVGDVETAAGSLTLSAASSNTTLVPVANVVFGGTGANRTVAVTPAANQFGSALITITVRDADGGTATEEFTLTVNGVNDAPTISTIANVTTPEDTATGPIAFTVGDLETAAASLTLSATSSNTTLVPSANIVFSGGGTNRTTAVVPAANLSGTATITITVSDGTAQSSTSFVVTVTPVNDPPTVTAQRRLKTHMNTALALAIGDFTVTDQPGAPGENNTPFSLSVRAGTNYTFSGNTITPASNFVGDLTVNIRVTDSGTPPAFTDTTALVTVYNYIDNDTFTTPGNTRILGMTVRANDPDQTLAISGFTATTSPTGGTVTRNGNLFDAEPPVGLGNAPFTFTYTVTDADAFTDTATVTVNTTTPIWYVNSALGTNGNGRFTSPFNNVASAVTASSAGTGHVIYLYAGSGSYGAITLANAQTLIGQGVDFSPTPNPSAPGVFIPAGGTPVVGGVISLTGGPFEVAGLNSTNSPAAGITATLSNKALVVRKVNVAQHAGAGLSVQNGSTLTVSDLVVSTPDVNSGRGIYVNNMSGAVSFSGTNASTSNGGASLEVTTAASFTGTFTNLVSTNGANGVVVTGAGGGALTVTSNVTATTPTGTGVLLSNVGAAGTPFNVVVGNKFTHTGGQIGLDVKNHLSGAITLGPTGAAVGAGVSITNTAAQGMRFNRATNVTLNGVQITTTGDDGIQIVDTAQASGPNSAGTSTVSGFSLVNATLTDTGNDVGEWGLDFGDGYPGKAQLDGTVVLRNVTITRPGYGGVHLENSAGTIPSTTPLLLENLVVTDTGNDGHGLLLRAAGTATIFAQVLTPQISSTSTTRVNYAGDGINAAAVGLSGARLDLLVRGGQFINAANTSAGAPGRGDNAIRLAADGGGTRLTFDLDGNTLQRWTGHGIHIDVGGEATGVSAEGFVRNNAIGLAGVPYSASEVGNGINVLFDGDTGLPSSATMQATIAVTNNVIRNAGLNGIQVQGRDATSSQQHLDLVLENNLVDTTQTQNGYDVRTVSNTAPANAVIVCANMSNNKIAGTMAGGNSLRLGVTAGANFLLPGYSGSTLAALFTYLSSRGNDQTLSVNAASGSAFGATGACLAPAAR